MGKATRRLPELVEPIKLMGRDELNLAEFPIASLSHRVPEDCKQLVFEDEIRDQATGEIVPRRLIVTGHATLGLPNSLDDDVIVVLMHVSKERTNFSSRTVPFHRMELVELLGWPRNGQSMDRVEESLSKWHGVQLRYEKAWWDKAAQEWRNEEFHIIDNVSSFDRKTARRGKQNTQQTSLNFSTFTWNEVVFNSFQAGNVKSIDLSTYFSLSLAQSRRAYRFLDKRFYREAELRFDLKTFATAKIGFSAAYSAAKIKEKLQPALDELEGVGFLEPMSREKRYEKISSGTWKIVLIRGNEVKGEQQQELPFTEEVISPLVSALTSRGVSDKTAAELVSQHQAETIQQKIDVYDWLMAKQDKRVAKSPEGYLVKSIHDDYKAPRGFTPAAERQQKAEAELAAKRQAADDRRREREEAKADQEHRQAVAEHLKTLTNGERAELEAKALSAASPEEQANYAAPFMAKFRTTLMDGMIREYLRPLLTKSAAAEA